MNRAVATFALLVASLVAAFYPTKCPANDLPCTDVPHIELSNDMDRTEVMSRIGQAFSNLAERYSQTNGRYELCFDIVGSDLIFAFDPISATLDFGSNAAHDIYVRGLKFKRYSGHITAAPILTITNNTAQKVTLDGLRLLDVKDGLALAGNGPIEIVNSTVAGAQGKEGTCVAVRSQGAKIVHSDISACLEGVRIEAGDALLGAADAAHWAEEKNTIHHNGTGIRVVSGGRNRFGYNSIFGNYVLGQTSGRDNGIKIEQTATVEVLRPKVIFDEASGAAIRCTRLPDGKIAKREIWFKPEATGGEVQVFRTSASDFMQGKTFFASCSLAQDGKCELGNWQIDISELQKVCWPDEFAVAMLYTGTSSSMYADVPISLAGVFSTPAPPLYEMPTPSGARPDDERPKLPLESGEVVPVPGPGGTDPDASAEPQGRKAGFALPSPNCTLLKD